MIFNHEDHIITNQKDTVKQYKITTKTTPITMSSFTIRTDRKQKSNRRRVGGGGRRSRPTGKQGYSIGAFLKASQKVAPIKPRVDSDGFVMVTKRPRNHRQSPLSRRPKRNTKCVNAFAVLATSPPKTIEGPAFVKA